MSIIKKNSFANVYFSAQLPDVEFSISGSRANVVVSVDSTVIYDEVLVPLNGGIAITDLAGMVEPWVEQVLVANLTVDIRELDNNGNQTASEKMSTQVLFSRAYINASAEEFYSGYFLSTLIGTKITAMKRLEYLHYYGTDAATVTAHYDDGSSQTFPGVAVAGNSRYTTLDVSPQRFLKAGRTLCCYTVSVGSRQQSYTVDHNDPDCAPVLLFTNSFGVQELLYCTGTHEVDPKYTRSNAIFSGKYNNYDIEELRTFKADTGIMNTAMANWADDLFRSREIYIVNFYNGNPQVGMEIAITDSNSKNDNNDETLPRFTFDYRYAQRNHNVIDIKRAGRIFDNTFDNTFN